MRAKPSPQRNGSPWRPDSSSDFAPQERSVPSLRYLPERRMLDVVLQIAIGGARGVAHPGGNKDAHRDQALGMHVEEAEDLRLRVAEAVPDGSGFESGVFRQLDDELHAQRPFALCVAFGQAELIVECLADRADRAVADDGQRRLTSIPAIKPSVGAPDFSTP